MSMTREEASSVISDMILEMEYPNGIYHQKFTEDESRKHLALYAAKKALRPVSREQVEKVWRAHWNESVHLGGFVYCSRCGYNALEANNYTFCPKCGSPFTDEAVEMVMERLEGIENGTVPCDNA